MSKKIAYYGVFAALAVLMGYVEAMIPIPLPVQGIKLGLANVVVVTALYLLGDKAAFNISIIRVFVSALFFKGFMGFWYSFAGAFVSFFVMLLAKKSGKLSEMGVSVLGGVFHNIAQLLVAAVFLGSDAVLYLAPVLMAVGALTGFGIGLVAKFCSAYLKNRYF